VAVELLSSAGYEVETLRGALDEADQTAALDGVHLLGIRSGLPLRSVGSLR
jgi:D-3-phosphoglycerate dehydrogenase